MHPILGGLLRSLGGSEANFLEDCFGRIHGEISTPRQLLRSLGPLPETFARTRPNFREVPPKGFPVGRLAGRLSYPCKNVKHTEQVLATQGGTHTHTDRNTYVPSRPKVIPKNSLRDVLLQLALCSLQEAN